MDFATLEDWHTLRFACSFGAAPRGMSTAVAGVPGRECFVQLCRSSRSRHGFRGCIALHPGQRQAQPQKMSCLVKHLDVRDVDEVTRVEHVACQQQGGPSMDESSLFLADQSQPMKPSLTFQWKCSGRFDVWCDAISSSRSLQCRCVLRHCMTDWNLVLKQLQSGVQCMRKEKRQCPMHFYLHFKAHLIHLQSYISRGSATRTAEGRTLFSSSKDTASAWRTCWTCRKE